ncbi:unnamed protein product [Didymodactylos carnosus]|uniref:Uncharacterized protein n=1 Tax=Didymodactylos carnosus TaxID=1234261 RepID=A0A8S2IEC8_9BILA|nr:unnamed protein product [Didymodactylos carnosus]CAF3718915.1 unnamed protein product [Didymodactylos carnosus]
MSSVIDYSSSSSSPPPPPPPSTTNTVVPSFENDMHPSFELKISTPFHVTPLTQKSLSSSPSYLTKSTNTSLPIGLLSHSDSLNNHKHFQFYPNHVQTSHVATNDPSYTNNDIYFHVIPSASTLAGTIVPLLPSSSTSTTTTTVATYDTFDQQSFRTVPFSHNKNPIRYRYMEEYFET